MTFEQPNGSAGLALNGQVEACIALGVLHWGQPSALLQSHTRRRSRLSFLCPIAVGFGLNGAFLRQANMLVSATADVLDRRDCGRGFRHTCTCRLIAYRVAASFRLLDNEKEFGSLLTHSKSPDRGLFSMWWNLIATLNGAASSALQVGDMYGLAFVRNSTA